MKIANFVHIALSASLLAAPVFCSETTTRGGTRGLQDLFPGEEPRLLETDTDEGADVGPSSHGYGYYGKAKCHCGYEAATEVVGAVTDAMFQLDSQAWDFTNSILAGMSPMVDASDMLAAIENTGRDALRDAPCSLLELDCRVPCRGFRELSGGEDIHGSSMMYVGGQCYREDHDCCCAVNAIKDAYLARIKNLVDYEPTPDHALVDVPPKPNNAITQLCNHAIQVIDDLNG